MRPAEALLLGLLQGPAELLPISSSGHLTLVPWLVGRARDDAGAEAKAFDVAVHAGAAPALLVRPRTPPGVILASAGPAAVAGLALEGPIERALGTPRGIAAGLALGSAAMLAADREPGGRRARRATLADGLWLGLAQAAALVPGVSRTGATLAAARARGFARADAWTLSRDTGVPVVAGAAVLKAVRLGRGPRPGSAPALGAAAALGSAATVRRLAPRAAPLWPFALYRLVLAAVTVRTAARRSSFARSSRMPTQPLSTLRA